jgi:predicted tellurium resistance membrane protein TerC
MSVEVCPIENNFQDAFEIMDADYQQLVALVQVIIIDLALAGDNAVVVGLAASRVARRNRAQVIFWGTLGQFYYASR